jgi:hypothetical protein
MKSYKLFLPLLAVLLLSGASSALAADFTRTVIAGPAWDATAASGHGTIGYLPGQTLEVQNNSGVVVWVKFRLSNMDPLNEFSVNPGALSPAIVIATGSYHLCVSTASGSSCSAVLDMYAADIPTLSEWAMIVFSVLLLGMMTYYVVRRRRVAHTVAM